ncbi:MULTISPECIES: hypothetical protein [Pontibacillus]|uniref:hypothetical protein n=1 Tax=Pontibacillus TaxID=289201 RepID=UPI00339CE244
MNVIINVDKEPADNNGIIFHQLISFEGFTASLDTITQSAIDAIDNMKIPSVDTIVTSIVQITVCILYTN